MGQADEGPQNTEWGAHIDVEEVARCVLPLALAEFSTRQPLSRHLSLKLSHFSGTIGQICAMDKLHEQRSFRGSTFLMPYKTASMQPTCSFLCSMLMLPPCRHGRRSYCIM